MAESRLTIDSIISQFKDKMAIMQAKGIKPIGVALGAAAGYTVQRDAEACARFGCVILGQYEGFQAKSYLCGLPVTIDETGYNEDFVGVIV